MRRVILDIERQRQGFVAIDGVRCAGTNIIRHAPEPLPEIGKDSFGRGAGADRIHALRVSETGGKTYGG